MSGSSLASVIESLEYPDAAKVRAQLAEQRLRVEARLAGVRRKLLVFSGKGGVGKSTVTSQLALALARAGERVGILDADINGPSIPRMLGLLGRTMPIRQAGAEPPAGPYGVKVASMSFLSARGPLRWKGPLELAPAWLGLMEFAALRELLADVRWGELDTLIIDLPPGASADKPPAIVNLVAGLDGALAVSTGCAVALDVVRRSIVYARDLGAPILGLVENMSGLFPGDAGALAEELAIPVLLRLPVDGELARSLESGVPLSEAHAVSRLFDGLARRLPGGNP